MSEQYPSLLTLYGRCVDDYRRLSGENGELRGRVDALTDDLRDANATIAEMGKAYVALKELHVELLRQAEETRLFTIDECEQSMRESEDRLTRQMEASAEHAEYEARYYLAWQSARRRAQQLVCIAAGSEHALAIEFGPSITREQAVQCVLNDMRNDIKEGLVNG